jgi:hypothetical protein
MITVIGISYGNDSSGKYPALRYRYVCEDPVTKVTYESDLISDAEVPNINV